MTAERSEQESFSTESPQDSIQRFIESNQLDEQSVNEYKSYQKYSDWVDRWFLPTSVALIILSALIGVAETQFLGADSEIIVTGFSWIAFTGIGVLFLIFIASALARWYSDLSQEDVAYHEIAAAFAEYRQEPDNLKTIFVRLETATNYFHPTNFKRISKKDFEEAQKYIDKIIDADQSDYISDEFHDTFPRFMQKFSASVTDPSDTTFSDLSKQMSAAYTGEISLRKRAKSDAKDILKTVFSGPELLISGGAIILISLVYFQDVGIGIAVGAYGFLFALYSHLKNRD